MILIVGAGPMAQEYAKILKDENKNFTVVGRSEGSAKNFKESVGIVPFIGGLDKFCSENNASTYTSAIVATGVEQLFTTTSKLISEGIKKILVEKPAGLNIKEIELLSKQSGECGIELYVAYNRRFFSSVEKAQEIIEQDGGVTSFNFEVTEWGHVIQNLTKAEGVKEHWFLANSSHVSDLAFFLCGRPEKITCFTDGALKWHPTSARFCGAGRSIRGALFSYRGDWEAPGRWGLEVLTKRHKLIFCPIEKLKIQKLGSVEDNFIECDDLYDLKYKPGLYKQINSFMQESPQNLCNIEEHLLNSRFFIKMAGYN